MEVTEQDYGELVWVWGRSSTSSQRRWKEHVLLLLADQMTALEHHASEADRCGHELVELIVLLSS